MAHQLQTILYIIAHYHRALICEMNDQYQLPSLSQGMLTVANRNVLLTGVEMIVRKKFAPYEAQKS